MDRHSTAGQRWTAGLCLVVAALVVTLGLPTSAALPAVLPVVATPRVVRPRAGPATSVPASTAVAQTGVAQTGVAQTNATAPPVTDLAEGPQASPAVAPAPQPAAPSPAPAPVPPRPPSPRPPAPSSCTTDPLVVALVGQLQALAKTLGPGAGALLTLLAKAVTCG